MAYNVISCKKIERNTQKIKIADFTMSIRLPSSEMTKNRQKNGSLNRNLLNFLYRYGIFWIKYQIYCTQIVNNFNYLAASTVQVMLLYSGTGRLVPLVVFSSFHYSGKEFLQTFTPSRELAVLIISFLQDPAILAGKEIA